MSRTLKDNMGMHIQTLACLRSTWTCQHSHNQTYGTQGSRHSPISHKSRHDGNVRAVSSGSHSWSPRTAMGQSYRLDRTDSLCAGSVCLSFPLFPEGPHHPFALWCQCGGCGLWILCLASLLQSLRSFAFPFSWHSLTPLPLVRAGLKGTPPPDII